MDKSQMRVRPGFLLGLLIVFLISPVALNLLFLPLARSGPSKMGITQSRAQVLWIGMAAYKDEFGKFPIGENAAVMQFLLGNNPKRESFVPLDGRQPDAINVNGECVDGFGTPFQINVASTNGLVIRSAGINKKIYDKDDVVFTSNGFVNP
jgi:hypothetical protein